MNQAYLFNKGKNYQSYNFLGAHPIGKQGVGYRFSVWAPNAKSVCVTGDFNNWHETSLPMIKDYDTGIWTLEVLEAKQWQRYKYVVTGKNDRVMLKADPFARHAETRPNTASVLYNPAEYKWQDQQWMENRKCALEPQPLNIYECHLGSWRQYPDGNFYNYRTMAVQLADYLLDMGYNALEIMPITEYPLDDSWGYQATGYFAPTSRYGTPDDFKFFVDHMHSKNIRVILDWVPAHFPRDSFGLARFDGTPLYEYADTRLGEHQSWGTLVFDYSKKEVLSFLYSSAWYWMDEFHIDGLRVDAVSSMIYLDYDRDDFVQNRYGGNENLEALDFMRNLNDIILKNFPGTMMMAEESTAYPYVTKPTKDGGLGFTHKWNMGWMHDTLKYYSLDYIYRPYHHNQLTFSMTYAFSERYVLAFSHDEVVHGKKSLLEKMPGDRWRQFANYRAMLMYMMSHPGSKLNFMGYEFGQSLEWRFKEELEWNVLEIEENCKLHGFVRELNHFYLDSPALWEQEMSWYGFEWMQAADKDNSVYAYSRTAKNSSQVFLVILNLTPAVLPGYRLRAPQFGTYRILFNSDDSKYGGSDYLGNDYADLRFETNPKTPAAANEDFEEKQKAAKEKRSKLQEKRDALEADRVALYREYKKILKEYPEDDDAIGNPFLGLDTAIAEVPEITPQYASPGIMIDLPPLSAMYLTLIKPENDD